MLYPPAERNDSPPEPDMEKLKVMAQMLSEPDNNLEELSFEERFGIMVEKEWLSKKREKVLNEIKSLLVDDNNKGINNAI
ncbi:MAG: IstB-like ATP-binding domain-containing protein [Firmicutes bacterium]|nr:IstB-like ATP-binding domain-containing protein [Bacillota bacterium]